MNTDNRFARHATEAVAVAVIAISLGLPPTVLLLLACPLMMFFMMRGMNNSDSRSRQRPGDEDLYPTARSTHPHAGGRRPLDGSHERIDNP